VARPASGDGNSYEAPGGRCGDLAENSPGPFRTDEVGSLPLEFGPIHPGEPRPPRRRMRFEKLDVEYQHELRLGDLVLGQPVPQQGHGASGLGDGAGARGFVVDGLADQLAELLSSVSAGYARGRFDRSPDRKE